MRKAGSIPDSNGIPIPQWLRVRVGKGRSSRETSRRLAAASVSTVCESARCPNIGECFSRNTATFLILGPRCTRGCAFCAVPKGAPAPVDPDEPERVAACAEALGSNHVVITSTTRDDLWDGGAGQFVQTIEAVRRRIAGSTLEVLVPDFGGSAAAVDAVLGAGPDVFNHNLETIARFYSVVRPGAGYLRSLDILRRASRFSGPIVKSGFMVGLGEEYKEVMDLLTDLYSTGCETVTIGQYLKAKRGNLDVVRYVEPTEFEEYRRAALGIGFRCVESGPFVRSSYRAKEVYQECRSSTGQ